MRIFHIIVVIFPELLELIMAYKMLLNYNGIYTALTVFSIRQFSEAKKNPWILTVYPSNVYIFST